MANKNSAKKSPTTKRKKKVLDLPIEFGTMDSYIGTHKTELMNAVVDRVQYALRNELEVVEIFKFTDTNYTVTLKSVDFYDNISNICDHFLESEQYEYCNQAFKIKQQLEK